MSQVYVSKRKESQWEPIIHAERLKDSLEDFGRRNFGIKSLKKRRLTDPDGFSHYYSKIVEYKRQINFQAVLLVDSMRSANAIYPVTLSEWDDRRHHLNDGLVRCELINGILQDIVRNFMPDFGVKLDAYEVYIKAIDREIDLIKRWRQRDNKIKSQILKKGDV